MRLDYMPQKPHPSHHKPEKPTIQQYWNFENPTVQWHKNETSSNVETGHHNTKVIDEPSRPLSTKCHGTARWYLALTINNTNQHMQRTEGLMLIN